MKKLIPLMALLVVGGSFGPAFAGEHCQKGKKCEKGAGECKDKAAGDKTKESADKGKDSKDDKKPAEAK